MESLNESSSIAGEVANAIKLVVLSISVPTIGAEFYTLLHKDFLPFLEDVYVLKGYRVNIILWLHIGCLFFIYNIERVLTFGCFAFLC